MDALEDFENLSINMDLDDGTSLSPHWNTDLRRRMPEGPQSHITPFVRDRATAQTLASVNRFGRNQLSCGADCPPNTICYPKGDRCILGDERPGKEHCCEFNNALPQNPPDEFLKTVAVMSHHADQHPGVRSYSDPGFFRAFKRLFAPVLQQNLQVHSNTFFPQVMLLQFFPFHARIDDAEQKLRLVLFGCKLFHMMIVRFMDDLSIIRDVDEALRNNPNFYWDCDLTANGNSNTFPPDFICIARNLNITATPTSHTEQDVFDMIVEKLNDTNDAASNVVVQIAFQQAGSADFSAITRACLRSSFKGRILCSIYPQTQVTGGMFGSIGIYVTDTPTRSFIRPDNFSMILTLLTHTLIIESH